MLMIKVIWHTFWSSRCSHQTFVVLRSTDLLSIHNSLAKVSHFQNQKTRILSSPAHTFKKHLFLWRRQSLYFSYTPDPTDLAISYLLPCWHARNCTLVSDGSLRPSAVSSIAHLDGNRWIPRSSPRPPKESGIFPCCQIHAKIVIGLE